MEYTVEFDEDKGICNVTVTGIHQRPQDSIILQKFALRFSFEHNCKKFLFDMRQAEIIGNMKDTYIVSTVPVEHKESLKQAKVAFLYADDLENHKFLEYLAIKSGHNVCIFNNYDSAINWLMMDL